MYLLFNLFVCIHYIFIQNNILYTYKQVKQYIHIKQYIYTNYIYGRFMSAFTKQRVRSDSEYSLQVFWQYIIFVVETNMFFIFGITVGMELLDQKVTYIRKIDYQYLPLIYLAVLFAKFVSVALFMNTLKKLGYGFKWSEAFIFTYSGARGALQLSFALIVIQERSFSDMMSQIILFHITGIVILTMLINGSTTSMMSNIVGLSTFLTAKKKVQLNFLQEMKDQIEIQIEEMKASQQMNKIDWDKVRYFSGVEEVGKDIEKKSQLVQKKAKLEEKQKLRQQQNSLEMKLMKHLQERELQLDFEDEDDENIEEELIFETRELFLMALKQTYWELYSQNQCSGKALYLLVQSVNWDLDTCQIRMCSWDFLYNLFNTPIYIRFLYWLKSLPVVGNYASNLLFQQIGMGYEVISTYVKAHEEMESMVTDFPISAQLQRVITKEAQENRVNAERFIEFYLSVSFPEIIRLIQTRKASLTILRFVKDYIEQKLIFGEIEQIEHDKLSLQLNQWVGIAEDLKPHWVKQDLPKQLLDMEIFSEFTEELLRELVKKSREMIFDKDQCITREGDLARYVFIILRGQAKDTSQNPTITYNQLLTVGHIISSHHIALQSTLYLTQCIADALVEVLAVPIELMLKLTKKSHRMQNLIWINSLYSLSRLFPKELKPLNQIEKPTLDKLKDSMIYVKKKKKQVLTYDGFILLSGKVEESGDEEESPQRIKDRQQYYGPCLFPFRNLQYTFKCLTTCALFVFNDEKKESIIKLIHTDLSGSDFFGKEQHEVKQFHIRKQNFGYSYLLRGSKVQQQYRPERNSQMSNEFISQPQLQ